MGQRGAAAAFLAAKYVFPGGALEAGDAAAGVALPPGALGARCAARLSRDPPAHPDTAAPALAQPSPAALAAAALRETREETGLALPAGLGLRFVFRAITPPGRPRRYDARFFLAEAEHLPAAPDRFGATDGELTDLRWLPLAEARGLDLPFVTAVMLAEIGALARLQPDQAPGRVGFIDNRTSTPQFHWID